jgi:hypothetical protein
LLDYLHKCEMMVHFAIEIVKSKQRNRKSQLEKFQVPRSQLKKPMIKNTGQSPGAGTPTCEVRINSNGGEEGPRAKAR